MNQLNSDVGHTESSMTSVSVITVCFNSEQTIRDTIESVLGQSYPFIEYIVIDGRSRDGTVKIIQEYKGHIAKIISEPDEGLYHAMNKGILMASGEIVCILNSDDIFADSHVIRDVVAAFLKTGAACVFGDLVYVKRNDTDRIVRRWISTPFQFGTFQTGWHPPHPAFFVRKQVYDEIGAFNTSIPLVADYDFMLRVLEIQKCPSHYLPRLCVRMRIGGVTSNSVWNNLRALWYILKILNENKINVRTVPFIIGRFVPKIIDRIKIAVSN
jgi:glycosyltransferase involved in cell wall biosynthesis